MPPDLYLSRLRCSGALDAAVDAAGDVLAAACPESLTLFPEAAAHALGIARDAATPRTLAAAAALAAVGFYLYRRSR